MESKEEAQIPPPHQLLPLAQIQMVYGNYAHAAQLCSEALKLPSDFSPGSLLQARQIRFEALRKLQTRQQGGSGPALQVLEAQRLLISDAFAIVQEDDTHPVAHGILYKHFMSTKDEPCRALYHHSQDMSSHLFMDVFPGVYCTLHDAAQTYSGRQSLLIKEVFSTCETHFIWINMLEPEREEKKREVMAEMRIALELLKKVTGINVPIGDFAYSACLLMFSEFFEQNQETIFSSIQESDITSAIQKLGEIAEGSAPPHLPRDPTTSLDNQRIGYAQLLMGLLFEHGRLVKKSYSEAERWFKKAALGHNMGKAALHLGMMYFNGSTGNSRNIELAQLYLEQAVASRNPLASPPLAVIYLHQLEFSKALSLLQQVSKDGVQTQTNDRVVKGELFAPQYMKWMKHRVSNCVIKFQDKMDILRGVIEKIELDFNLTTKGLTFLDRVKRAELRGLKFNVATMIDVVEVILELQPGPLPDWICQQGDERGGAGGTAYFRQVAEVREGFRNVYERMTSGGELGTDELLLISKTLRNCFENSPSLKLGLYLCRYYDSPTRSKLRSIMKSLLENPHLSVSHLTFRFLFVMFNWLERVESAIGTGGSIEDFKLMRAHQFLDANPAFPQDPLFYQWVGEMEHVPDCPELLKRTLDGLVRGVQKYPTNVALRAALADYQFRWYSLHMDEVGAECEEVGRNPFKCRREHSETPYPFDPLTSIVETIQSLREILRLAPVDHPLVPVSAYTLAWATARLLIDLESAPEFELGPLWTLLGGSDREGSLEKLFQDVAQAYTQGVVSESKQLKWFPQTAGCIHMKRRVELFMTSNSTHFPRGKLETVEDRKHWFGKPYLMSPLRIFSVTGLRFRLQGDSKPSSVASVRYEVDFLNVFMTKFRGKNPDFIKEPLTILRIHSPTVSKGNMLPGHVKLTVIDDVYFGAEHIHVLTEDENGNTIFVVICDKSFISRVDRQLTLEFGTTLIVARIVYKVSGEEPAVLWVGKNWNDADEAESQVILTGKVNKMCRFCGAPDSTVECEHCKRTYCSAECLQNDIKFMKHEYICNKQ